MKWYGIVIIFLVLVIAVLGFVVFNSDDSDEVGKDVNVANLEENNVEVDGPEENVEIEDSQENQVDDESSVLSFAECEEMFKSRDSYGNYICSPTNKNKLNEECVYCSEILEDDCKERGEEWMRGFMVDIYFCNERYPDGGKECYDSDDCVGSCELDFEIASTYDYDKNLSVEIIGNCREFKSFSQSCSIYSFEGNRTVACATA
jgi:hypothetical protein